MNYDADFDLDDLRAERAAARRYRNQLLRHPDPRDPDFPEIEEEEEGWDD